MINVLVASIDTNMPDFLMERMLGLLPVEMQKSVTRFRRWQDRHRALLAKLLLRTGLQNLGFSEMVLDSVKYDAYGRPWIKGEVDFNISHSAEYVICALARGIRVGIDIESIRTINLADFISAFSESEMAEIAEARDQNRCFYDSWTQKESAVKADGRGLSIPLAEIAVQKNSAIIDATRWHLTPIFIHRDYSCHMATNEKAEYKITELYWHNAHLNDVVVFG